MIDIPWAIIAGVTALVFVGAILISAIKNIPDVSTHLEQMEDELSLWY